MTKDKKFLDKLQKAIDKITDTISKPSAKPTLDTNYEIKYDGSEKETHLLGLTTEWGQVIDREGFNKYMSVVQQREEIRKLPYFETLKKQGIVSEAGEVLDSKKFTEIRLRQSVLNNKENMM